LKALNISFNQKVFAAVFNAALVRNRTRCQRFRRRIQRPHSRLRSETARDCRSFYPSDLF